MPIDPLTAASIGIQGLNAFNSITGTSAKRAAALNYKYWKKQFDYAAAYNAPAAARQRLIEGEYNPALAIGNMPLTQTASPQMGGASASDYSPDNMMPSILMHQQLQNAKAQEETIRADTALKEQEFRFNEENNPTRLMQGQGSLKGTYLKNEYQDIINRNLPTVQQLTNKGLDLRNRQTQKFITQMDEAHRTKMSMMFAEMSAIAKQNEVRDSQIGLNQSQTSVNRMNTVINSMEAEMNQKGTSFKDNPIMRSIINTAKDIRDAFKGDKAQRAKAEKQSQVMQWVLDPQSK